MSSSIKKGAITSIANGMNGLPSNAIVPCIKLARNKYNEILEAKKEMDNVKPILENNNPTISGKELRDEFNSDYYR